MSEGPAQRVVVLAPNWLGDAVLALPAIGGVRRAFPAAQLAVAARGSVAAVFRLAPAVDRAIPLRSDARWWRLGAFREDVEALRGFDVALLLPHSFHSAWLVKKAGIRERWGYASDLRSPLLTRAVRRVKGGHQAQHYTRLAAALGCEAPDDVPEVDVSQPSRLAAEALLTEQGRQPGSTVVVLAPGAAYGRAKQWIPAHVATLIAELRERGMTCVLVGSAADARTGREIARALETRHGGTSNAGARGALIDLIGKTSIEMLAAVLACADVCVCNDSGAMHLAAAVGTRVVATFGPTNEHATRPLPRPGRRADVLTNPVWCRPCMLRECPIDHRCMTGLTPDRVLGAVVSP